MADKNDLLKTIDEQQQKLNLYEKRLRDVVTAYKSLVKEKEALEASLKALTRTSVNTGTSADQNNGSVPSKQQESDEADPSDGGSRVRIHEKISTLTVALTTLTEEKTRMETSFQADKKKLKREKEELEEKLKKKYEDAEKNEKQLSERNAELHSKLRSHQIEREKEQNNHGIMLRELQTLVALERSAKEELENQLDDLHRNLDKRDPIQEKCEEYRQQIRDLSNELQVVRGRMKAAEERASQTQPILVKLQEEMVDVKAQNQDAILREQCRANEAEDRLQQTARLSEDRVASLELKLSELSEIVGSTERVRQQDQQAIQRLKERVAQLDIENTALVLAAGHQVRCEEKTADNDEDLNLDVQSLVQKIMKLKGLLKVANQKSHNAINLDDFLRREGFVSEPDHEACKEELFRLKEEFERYKQRAQSVLKNRNARDGDSFKEEVETLKSVVADLKNKVIKLTEEMEERETDHLRKVQGMEAALVRAKSQSSQEIARREAEFKTTVAELESQMQKQRTRTMALIEEKEAEMKLLKMSLGILKPSSSEEMLRKDEEDNEDVFSSGEGALSSELSRLLSMGNRDGHLLHYAQEIAKKDAEVSNLRRNKHQLEGALRELQSAVVARDERHYDEIENLQMEIGRLKRNCSREGANLEYLKNVVLSYMLSSDANNRRHMLNAIATLLKFSPKELHNVTQHNASCWWRQQQQPSTSSAPRSDGH